MNEMATEEALSALRSRCEGTGVSCHPFQLGWYHDRVESPFHLPYSQETLAVLLVSKPSMFEDLFLPFLASPHYMPGKLDPLDQCFKHLFSELKALFPPDQVETVHDFELTPGRRRPRVLVQTAGHVAGVARYYQRQDVTPDPWSPQERVYGVSVHPSYGGWFALRGVLLFKQLSAAALRFVEPEDCVPTQEMRRELLDRFNRNWRDWSYRDVVVGGVKETYSEEQKLYFSTDPSERAPLLHQLLNSSSSVSSSSPHPHD